MYINKKTKQIKIEMHMNASIQMTVHLLPPNSSVTGVKYLFEASRTKRPTDVDPVKKI